MIPAAFFKSGEEVAGELLQFLAGGFLGEVQEQNARSHLTDPIVVVDEPLVGVGAAGLVGPSGEIARVASGVGSGVEESRRRSDLTPREKDTKEEKSS